MSESKICVTCNNEKPLSDFRGRRECRKCENQKRIIRRDKKLSTDSNYREKYLSYDAKRKVGYRRRMTDIQKTREKISSCIRKGISRRGFTKMSPTQEILGCSYEYARDHISTMFLEGMSWDNHGDWHIDHIIPISHANTYDEVVLLNHYTNLQPLWGKDNRSKSNSLI